MHKLDKEINRILSNWNPIGVDEHVAFEEYSKYVPDIIRLLKSGDLVKHLEKILAYNMGLNFDKENPEHIEDLFKIQEEIISIFNKIMHKK